MNDKPADREPEDRAIPAAETHDAATQDRELARRKLVGRAMVVGLLLLVAVYAVFTFLGRR